MKQIVFALIGVPGSGKTWITSQIAHKFHFIHHDGFSVLKQPGLYLQTILEEAPSATKPILIECPFSVSEVVGPLEAAGYTVKQIYIVPEPEVAAVQYWRREGRPIPKGHLTRLETYRQRAAQVGTFAGDSSQVLEYLKSV